MKHRAALLTTILAIAATASAEAQVSCGATITANTTLTSDIFCPPAYSPVFTVKGPAKVDMNGHRVFGCGEGGTGIGIDIVGSGATLKNGVVYGCDDGAVRVRGTGKHRVENVVAQQSYIGFLIESGGNTIVRTAAINGAYLMTSPTGATDGNKLTDNVSVDSGENGFELEGDHGSYDRNIASSPSGSGFVVVGHWNSLRYNVARDSHEFGFEIDGTVNRLERNLSHGAGEDAFRMPNLAANIGTRMTRNVGLNSVGYGYHLGAGTVFMNNVAVGNDFGGVRSNHPGTSIIETAAIDNRGEGIFASGDNTIVRRNRCLANQGGIDIGDGTNITITKNVAVGNSIDVSDGNACAGHTWSENVFGTADPFCP
jgi:parallel beta-helix repeat protein